MQTAQRRIPIGGDDGKMKTWEELLPCYEQELANLRRNIAMLRAQERGEFDEQDTTIKPLHDASTAASSSSLFTWQGDVRTVSIGKGVRLFADLDSVITDFAPELEGLTALVMSSSNQRQEGTTLSFSTKEPVQLLIGYFRDDQMKYAKAPKLETDATGNEYGQAEPILTNAISIVQLPKVNIHQYALPAGHNTIRLPKGILMVAGFTDSTITPRDCGLSGPSSEVDWLFQR